MTALMFATKIGSLDVVKLATGREKYGVVCNEYDSNNIMHGT